jgi:Zn-dependent protease with chaperone function
LAITNQKPLNWVDKLNWEVIIIMDKKMMVECDSGGGMIRVYTGFLDRFNTEDEIAAVLAHEVVIISYFIGI